MISGAVFSLLYSLSFLPVPLVVLPLFLGSLLVARVPELLNFQTDQVIIGFQINFIFYFSEPETSGLRSYLRLTKEYSCS